MPEFWNDDGTRVTTINQVGCYDSEFDQYGDTEAFGEPFVFLNSGSGSP